jgi:ferredoxin
MAHRKQGYRFENDYTYESRKEKAEKIWKSAITIPVNVDIKAEHLVLNLDKVKEYLINARKIAVLDCECRVEFQNCEAPLNVCISLNDRAEVHLVSDDFKDYHPREVSVDEALDVLKKSHEAGLVHMAYSLGEDREPDDVGVICSCCSCCCGILSGILRFGVAPHLLTSQAISVTDTSDCNECGVCAERCQFGAREMVNGSLSFNPDLCFGCGLCVSTCPTGAITLVDK